jgi:hypothetical protein
MQITKSRLIKSFGLSLSLAALALLAAFAIVPKTTHATTTSGYTGEYWNNPTGPGGQSPSFPNRAPDLTRTDNDINFDWWLGAPGPGIQNEDFVVRWTKTTYLAAGNYEFNIRGDDGVRVYIDGEMIVDGWVDQGASTIYDVQHEITAGEHEIKVEFYENGGVAEVYFNYSNLTDGDSDGIDNAIEDAGPNGGDANDDGTPDSTQANVASYINPVTGKYAALDVSNTCTIFSANSQSESSSSKDIGFEYPAGLMNFTLDCSSPGMTAQINQYYFGLTNTSTVARKYDSANHSYQAIAGAAISQLTVGSDLASKVSYDVTDGGALDQDDSSNSRIVDPAGVATVAINPPNTGLGNK